MYAAAAAVETIHNAGAPMPRARGEDEDYTHYQSRLAQGIESIREQALRGFHTHADVGTIDAILDLITNPNKIDDRKLLVKPVHPTALVHILTHLSPKLEKVLYLMANLPDSRFSGWLENQVVMLLYNDLPHPAATYIGDRYDFRRADGSLNNVNLPAIGKAGHAYARNVQGSTAMPVAELPDPGLIFEALLKREHFVPHPAGNSSLMFGCAIDFVSILSSLLSDPSVSASPPLSSIPASGPITLTGRRTTHLRTLTCLLCTGTTKRSKTWYGTRQEEESCIMMYLRRTGCSSFLLSPVLSSCSTAASTTTLRASYYTQTYSYLHATLRDKLLEINERQRWVDPSNDRAWEKHSEEQKMKQDDQIFNTARLINCGHFASAVFGDYLHSSVSSRLLFLFVLTLAQDPRSLHRPEPLVAKPIQ